jgi:hypothetical protein
MVLNRAASGRQGAPGMTSAGTTIASTANCTAWANTYCLATRSGRAVGRYARRLRSAGGNTTTVARVNPANASHGRSGVIRSRKVVPVQ